MKIAFDISNMNKLSKNRGIGTYAQNLFSAIKEYTDVDIELIEQKKELKKFDVIHYPFFDFFKHTLPLKSQKPAIVTIHDLIPLQFFQHYPPGIKGGINWYFQKLALKNTSSVITVSETVKKDIIEILKIPDKKISVVLSAPSKRFKIISDKKILENAKNKYNLSENFVLYVGNTNWNKNILNMTESVMKAGKQLVIVGDAFLDRDNLDHPEKKQFKIWIEKYKDEKRIKILGNIPTENLVIIMNLAKCLVFVSFYEGFGLPILEAQACGLPVITSNISATAEIAGNSAILVDPKKVEEISKAINNIFSSESLGQELIKLGDENAKKYSWKKAAFETVKVYENVLA